MSVDASDDGAQQTPDISHTQEGQWDAYDGVCHRHHSAQGRLRGQMAVT